MSEKHGDGLVYHRSDCGSGYVRLYGGGGDMDGTACGKWALADWQIDIIHKYDWNFKSEDLTWLIQFHDGLLGIPPLSAEEFQLKVNLIAGCHTDGWGHLLNDDGSRQDGQNPMDGQGFFLAHDINGNCPDQTRKECPENHARWQSLVASMGGDMSAFGGGPETWKSIPYDR